MSRAPALAELGFFPLRLWREEEEWGRMAGNHNWELGHWGAFCALCVPLDASEM